MARRTLTRGPLPSSAVALLALALAGRAFGQAEEAPATYEPPPGMPVSVDPERVATEREGRAHPWMLSLFPRYALSMSDGATGLTRHGFGAGVSLSRAVFVRGRMRLGLGITFTYERQQGTRTPPPELANGDVSQYAAHAAFSLDLRLEGLFLGGVLRPWMAIGPAIDVAQYHAPPSTDAREGVDLLQPLGGLRAGFGIGGIITSRVELGGRVEWLGVFGADPVGMSGARPLSPGNFSVSLDLGFRF